MNLENFNVVNSNRDKFNHRCKTCQKIYQHASYMKNRDKEIANAKEWRKNNLDKARAIERKREGTPERVQYHREKSAYKRLKGNYKDWAKRNPEKVKEYGQNRMHKNHKITNKEWENCKKYFNHRCAYCGLAIENHWVMRNGTLINMDFHKEHKDDKGSSDLSNCVPACLSCNAHKWTFEFDDWYNENNPVFSLERLEKINKWLNEDYKNYIEQSD